MLNGNFWLQLLVPIFLAAALYFVGVRVAKKFNLTSTRWSYLFSLTLVVLMFGSYFSLSGFLNYFSCGRVIISANKEQLLATLPDYCQNLGNPNYALFMQMPALFVIWLIVSLIASSEISPTRKVA